MRCSRRRLTRSRLAGEIKLSVEKSDSQSIQFVGHPDVETYLALMKIVRSQKTWSTSGLVVVGLVVLAAIGILMKNGMPVFVAALTVLFLVGFFSLLPTFAKRIITKQRRVGYLAAMQKLKRTGLISSQGIQIKFTDGQTDLDWSHFDRIAKIDGAVGLCKGSELVDAISRSMFESSNEWEAARKIVLDKVPSGCQK